MAITIMLVSRRCCRHASFSRQTRSLPDIDSPCPSCCKWDVYLSRSLLAAVGAVRFEDVDLPRSHRWFSSRTSVRYYSSAADRTPTAWRVRRHAFTCMSLLRLLKIRRSHVPTQSEFHDSHFRLIEYRNVTGCRRPANRRNVGCGRTRSDLPRCGRFVTSVFRFEQERHSGCGGHKSAGKTTILRILSGIHGSHGPAGHDSRPDWLRW